MRGLPWQATVSDIKEFFKGYTIDKESGVFILNGPEGRPSGEAYVVFANEDDAKGAAQKLNKQTIMGRCVLSSEPDFPGRISACIMHVAPAMECRCPTSWISYLCYHVCFSVASALIEHQMIDDSHSCASPRHTST